MSQFIVLTGPTGTGKSAVGLALAHHLPIEIVNGDMGQLYTPLNIGTAKPTPLERMLVPHHLFDLLDQPVNFTVAQYRTRVQAAMQEIWARKNIPVVVGGSGFYIKSLFFLSPDLEKEPSNGERTHPMNQPISFAHKTAEELWQQLNEIDPVRASQIHPNDRYRIERALILWHETGELPSAHAPAYEPIEKNYHLFLLTRDREELYARIDQRVNEMMPAWRDEVRGLKDTPWEVFLCKKKIIGYCTLLEANDNADAITEIIQRDTRRYAKRQLTFFRSLLEQLPADKTTTINMTHHTIEDVAKKIASDILQTTHGVLYSREQK